MQPLAPLNTTSEENDQSLANDQQTYQLEPHNFSVEQIRYLERMKRASEKQNLVYRQNINKNVFMTEKEKYAKHLESEQHPV